MNRYQRHFDEMKMITTYSIYIYCFNFSFFYIFISFHGGIKILNDLKDYSFKHGNIYTDFAMVKELLILAGCTLNFITEKKACWLSNKQKCCITSPEEKEINFILQWKANWNSVVSLIKPNQRYIAILNKWRYIVHVHCRLPLFKQSCFKIEKKLENNWKSIQSRCM